MAADRGGVLPIPALIAAAVVCLAVSLYATTLLDRTPKQERTVVEPAADGALDRASDAGLVEPSRLDASLSALPDGYEGNVTVRVEGQRWTSGPTPPNGATTANGEAAATDRTVSVRVDRGRVRPGTFELVIWS